MAENIGKIVVAIEAEVAQLRQGLASAEAEFKKSAKKIEEQQKTLGAQFKKSWTEMASKINVVTVGLNVAGGVLRGLSGAMKVFGEEGTSSAEKVGGAIQAFGAAGIPIVSQLITVAEGLAEVFVQSASQIEAIWAEHDKKLASQRRVAGRRNAQAQADDLSRFVNTMATRYEVLKRAGDEEMQLEITRADERENLEATLQKRILQATMAGDAEGIAEQLSEARDAALQIFDMETELMDKQLKDQLQKKQDARDEEIRLEKEAAAKLAQQKIDDAKKVADKTMDLQTRLNIMLAKQAGDDEKARRLAIEARYRTMLEGASDVNRKIIEQMKAIELAAVGGGAVAETGGGTSTISTAIGSFTLAQGSGDPVQKEHTKLLKSISESSAVVARQMNRPSSQGIIVAS